MNNKRIDSTPSINAEAGLKAAIEPGIAQETMQRHCY